MLWDLLQQLQITENKIQANHAEKLSVTSATAIGNVADQVNTLVLANQAMWELVSEKLGISEIELVEKMNEIDLRDGKLDGKIMRVETKVCHECGHKIKRQRPRCYWCGARVVSGTPFA